MSQNIKITQDRSTGPVKDKDIVGGKKIKQFLGKEGVLSLNGQKVNPKPATEPESPYFCLKASICAVWIPSLVGDKDKMCLVSSIVSLISKVVILCVAVGIAFFGGQHLVFLLWCERSLSRMSTEENLEICSFKNHSCFYFSSEEDEKIATTILMLNGCCASKNETV